MGDARSNTPRVWNEETDLTELVNEQGPFVTVQIATPADLENAAQESELRWRSMCEQLAAVGTDEIALKGIDEYVADGHLEGETLYLIANDSGVRHVGHYPDAPTREFASRENLPVLAPLIELRQQKIAHVCATLDRRGAVIRGYKHQGNALHRVVDGDPSDPIRKVNAGGWSQRRYEMRAEDTWEHNAKAVAHEIVEVVDAAHARVLFLAGDVRAVQLCQEYLPETLRAEIKVVQGSRANDGSELIDETAVYNELDALVRNDSNLLLNKLTEELGQNDRAARGHHAVLERLASGQVEVLIIANSRDDQRNAWFGEDPTQVAVSEDRVRAMGARQPRSGRLVDVAIAAALRTGAGTWVVDETRVPDGIAAILRW